MERNSHKEGYLKNPLNVLRGLAGLAMVGARRVDDNLYEFQDARPYNELNYPPISNVEAPVATEAELSA